MYYYICCIKSLLCIVVSFQADTPCTLYYLRDSSKYMLYYNINNRFSLNLLTKGIERYRDYTNTCIHIFLFDSYQAFRYCLRYCHFTDLYS